MSTVKILCTGDLHLGRASSKYGPENDDTQLQAYSVRNVWGRIVDYAIDHKVHLVLLSGDIADDQSNQYEAMGPFEAGIMRLADHNIQVFLVAGNHDADTLPRMTSLFADTHVHLLGAGGVWEQVDWPSDGAPEVSLLGWSYPANKKVAELPLETMALQSHAGVPIIALAHTDYRSTGNAYASVTVEALRRCSQINLWLLGHIHAPEKLDGSPCILNPGSPQALDPGEPGCHGPWLLECSDGKLTSLEQIPLSTVVYANITVDVTGMTADEEVITRLLPPLQAERQSFPHASTRPRLACRIALTGRTACLNTLHENCQQILQDQPLLDVHNIYLERIDLSDVGPEYDQQALCARQDVIGTLARLLHALEHPEHAEEAADYLRKADEIRNRLLQSSACTNIESTDTLPTSDILVKTECGRLLDALLRQEEARA